MNELDASFNIDFLVNEVEFFRVGGPRRGYFRQNGEIGEKPQRHGGHREVGGELLRCRARCTPVDCDVCVWSSTWFLPPFSSPALYPMIGDHFQQRKTTRRRGGCYYYRPCMGIRAAMDRNRNMREQRKQRAPIGQVRAGKESLRKPCGHRRRSRRTSLFSVSSVISCSYISYSKRVRVRPDCRSAVGTAACAGKGDRGKCVNSAWAGPQNDSRRRAG